jgi:hypothetical protein
MSSQVRSNRMILALVAATVALALSACGGSSASSSSPSSSATIQAAASTSSTTSTTSAAPKLHLKVVSPKRDAQTNGAAVTVRVLLKGGRADGADPFVYVLDGRFSRRGARTLVLHGVRPGHQRLVVMLARAHGVRGSTVFVVTAPPPPPPPPQPSMMQPAPSSMMR